MASASALGLDPSRAVTQYAQEVFRTEQGLPQNGALALAQTPDGYLWIGTEEGLARYDGARFVVFDSRSTPELTSRMIRALHVDHEGALWIGTQSGGVLRLKDGRFGPSYARRDGLPSDQVSSLCRGRDGTLWVATNAGLGRIAGDRISILSAKDGLASDRILSVMEDSAGSIWIGTVAGLNRLDAGRVALSLTSRNGLPHDRVRRVWEAPDKELWITTSGGLARLRGGRITTLTSGDGLPSDTTYAVLGDRDGSVWAATAGGLARISRGKVEGFPAGKSPAAEAITDILEDREGSLWAGTFNAGLVRLRDGKVKVFGVPEGLPHDNVRAVLQRRDGSVWLGLQRGLVRAESPATGVWTPVDGPWEQGVNALREDASGRLWVATNEGLSSLDAASGRPRILRTYTTRDGLPASSVTDVREDRGGVVWASTGAGLARLTPGGAVEAVTSPAPLDRLRTTALLADRDGGLWVGSGESGLLLLRDGSVQTFGPADGLPDVRILSLHQDRHGVLFVGTADGGLARRVDGRFRSYREHDGLCDNAVFEVLEDDLGYLWMTSNRGVFRVKSSDLDAFDAGRLPRIPCLALGEADGMRSRECNGGSKPGAFRTADGRLWFGTLGGVVVVVDPARLPKNGVVPAVLVEEARSDGAPIVPDGTARIPAGRKRVEVRYTATSLVAPQRVRFRHRLEGFDRDWIEAGTQRTTSYTGLAPGRYTFRVVASNDDGVWNETGASLAFEQLPYFHQTRWFTLLLALSIGGVAWGAHRARVRHLARRERELVAVVEERTRDLRAEKEKVEKAQEKIAELMRTSPDALGSLPLWARRMSQEITELVGVSIDVFRVAEGRLEPISLSGDRPLPTPDLKELERAVGGAPLETADGLFVPVLGLSGDLFGAVLVHGRPGLEETSERLLAGFAHQLGGALEMQHVRGLLAAAHERSASAREEMQSRGVPTLQVCPVCGSCYDHTTRVCPADGHEVEAPGVLPYVLGGRYRFLWFLGQGGMGTVYAARDERLWRDVALKLIRPEHFRRVDFRIRFEREAQAVASIQHPGVVALFDSGELEDGTAFLVMERLVGCDLGRLLHVHGPGAPWQVAELLRQGASALGEAHRRGILHRDIKPGNVFLVHDVAAAFRVKLLDFGLAKPFRSAEFVSQSGIMVGTPGYMSPEQMEGKDLDTRSDVYALAAVVYEALSGRPVVSGVELSRLLRGGAPASRPLKVSVALRGVSAELDEALLSGLAENREDRPSDVEVWARPLIELLEGTPTDPRVAGWPEGSDVFERIGRRRWGGAVRTVVAPGA